MDSCFGCCYDGLGGCHYVIYWPRTKDVPPCKTHSREELEEMQRKALEEVSKNKNI